MAPEVIEMSGCSDASDIWSVGCTIVELLTGKPPYFDLAPMAALFRIVQDDHPPIPGGISPALHDFIMKCFKKEPRLRATAQDLLKHPWISSIPRNKVAQSAQLVEASTASNDDRDTVLKTIKLYEKVTEKPEFSVQLRAFNGEKERIQSGLKLEDLQEHEEDEDDEDWDDEFGVESNPTAISLEPQDKIQSVVQAQMRALKGGGGATGPAKEAVKPEFRLDEGEVDDFFWEDDDKKPLVYHPSLLHQSSLDITKFQEESTDLDGLDLDQLEQVATQSNLKIMRPPVTDEFNDNVFDVMDFEQKGTRDALNTRILELLSMLHPKMDDAVILSACEELHTIFVEHRAQRAQLVSQSGVIPNIMEALEVKNVQVLCAVLDVINLIIKDDTQFQENLALIGLVPIIVNLASTNSAIRLEAAKFVHQSCKTSVLTLQMFIACGGLPVLVNLLREETEIALDGILSVFTLQTIPKNDFCRLFVKAGLFQHLIELEFNNCKIADILLLFSQGDVVVKEHMSDLAVLDLIVQVISRPDVSTNVFLTLLKCLRNLSMEPNTVDKLDRAGVIPALVEVLGKTKDTADEKQVQNIVILSMYYLCRINRTRQTQAAQCGLVSFLQQVAVPQNPLKQFALPILCDLAHASQTARAQLWVHDGVHFFLHLLSDPYWQLDALNAIVVWLVNDTSRIESVLLEPVHLFKLVSLFRSAEQTDFENLLDPLLEILTKCVRLNQALGYCGLFVTEMVTRLSYPKAMVRKNLLKMLKSMFEASPEPTRFVFDFGLYPVVQRLAQDENMILVMEIANQLLQGFTASLQYN